MKTIYFTKDNYQNNSVRVSYFEKDAIKKNIDFLFNEETNTTEQIIKEQYYDKLLFCHRIEWIEEEIELDNYIQEVRQYWENRINT